MPAARRRAALLTHRLRRRVRRLGGSDPPIVRLRRPVVVVPRPGRRAPCHQQQDNDRSLHASLPSITSYLSGGMLSMSVRRLSQLTLICVKPKDRTWLTHVTVPSVPTGIGSGSN